MALPTPARPRTLPHGDRAGADDRRTARRAVASASCASLIGIGLARFAYTPLLPAIIDGGWFEASTAAYLGAANLAGYLAGALLGRPLAARTRVPVVLRAMMVVATAAFFACAYPLNVAWFFAWRFASGFAGGALMVLAAPAVLPHVPPGKRGLAGGLIFMGIGVGIAASGTLVPLLLRGGLQQAWFGLGALSCLLTVIGWRGWSSEAPAAVRPVAGAEPSRAPGRAALRALYAEYALNAAAWVPRMLFLVDLVARGLGQGIQAGSHYWVLFGLGATVGPILVGHLADRTGFGPALRLAFLVEAGAIAIPALGLGPSWLILSSVAVGAFVTGTVPLMLGRIGELLPGEPERQKAAWSVATVAFALFQAGAAYGLSFVFAHTAGNYTLLFALGTSAMVLALAIDLGTALATPRPASPARP
ncbi:YbfB/YjiJ family MFS transporter [Methylobacterium sp. HMF5984]|uniref:YbfB/YjiJ family MFS transporter n=1 Tax=Methylobacterium sp. HMF5984 TaxID=3367370 RepID=UPI0038544C40